MKRMKKASSKILAMLLAVMMIVGMLPVTAFATGTEEDVVYISVSDDGQFLKDSNSAPMTHRAVNLAALSSVDLDDYNLAAYKYDADNDGTDEITALHLYIYVHTVLFGLDWNAVSISGGAGSIYFAGGLFGFSDENLRYNYNGAYPADENGWGYTADHIVLKDGDYFDVAHFIDWSFWMDSAAGFNYFADGNDVFAHTFTAEVGAEMTAKVILVSGGMGSGDVRTNQAGFKVYYGTEVGNSSTFVETNDNGVAAITFPSAGTYYLWTDGGYGNEYPDAIVSAPAFAKVTVTGESTGGGSGSGEGSGNSGAGSDGSGETEMTDGKTALKVTADEGITLTANATFCCNEDCDGETEEIAASKVTSIDASVNWTCSTHNATTNGIYYMMSVNAFYAEDYIITGITVNDTEYAVDMTDDEYAAIYLDDYSYIAENTNCISIAIAAETELDDQVIHIKGEKKAEETPREPQDVSAVLNATMAQLAKTVKEPAFGTNAGEWTVFSLARGGYYTKDNKYFTDYYNRIVETVNTQATKVNLTGALHANKSTDNARLIVALSAIGKDATFVAGWDLVEAYSANGFDWIKKQGLNGTIWALIALDSNNYATSDTTIRQQCVDAIVAAQHDDGGWSLTANKTYASDPDMTGMALTALYPYRNQAAVAEVCAEAITCLSEMQNDDGTYSSGGAKCSESCAWVIVSTTTWGINPDTDSRFIKNDKSVVDGLLAHYLSDSKTFQHIIGAGSNAMATDQSCYALIAYDRLVNEKTALFDYSDVTFEEVDKVKAVEDLIDAIGKVTVDSGDLIKAARAAYDSLSSDDRKSVKNIDELEDAEEAYDALTVVQNVIDLIDAIGTVTVNAESRIVKARLAYNNLTAAQKKLVSNYYYLQYAEAELEEAKVEYVEDLIDSIGTVTKDSKTKIDRARTAYNNLSAANKKEVSNLSVLVAAEEAYKKLSEETKDKETTTATKDLTTIAGKVDEQLESISDDTMMGEVLDAILAYESLTEAEKAAIGKKHTVEFLKKQVAEMLQTDTKTGIGASGVDWNMQIVVSDPMDVAKVEEMKGELGDNVMLGLWDIHLDDILTDEEIQPDGAVLVKIPLALLGDYSAFDGLAVVHYADDGTVEYLNSTVIGDCIAFNAVEFSYFAVVGYEGMSPLGDTTNDTGAPVIPWVIAGCCALALLAVVICLSAKNKKELAGKYAE